PVLGRRVEGVPEHELERAFRIAQRDAVPPLRLDEGEELEIGRSRPDVVEPERRQPEGLRPPRHEVRGRRLRLLVLQVDGGPGGTRPLGAGARDLLGRKHGDRGRDSVHWIAPASSNMGMYISTTTPPTDRPRIAIRAGSRMRVDQSTKR